MTPFNLYDTLPRIDVGVIPKPKGFWVHTLVVIAYTALACLWVWIVATY